MRRIRVYIGENWYLYLLAVACMVSAIMLDMRYPVITKSIVDDVIMDGRQDLLTRLLVGIVVVGIGRSVCVSLIVFL